MNCSDHDAAPLARGSGLTHGTSDNCASEKSPAEVQKKWWCIFKQIRTILCLRNSLITSNSLATHEQEQRNLTPPQTAFSASPGTHG